MEGNVSGSLPDEEREVVIVGVGGGLVRQARRGRRRAQRQELVEPFRLEARLRRDARALRPAPRA